MALICELKQRVIHTSEVLLAAPCSGGYFRNSRENPDFGAFLADSWGEIFCDPRISLMLTIVYSDRNGLKQWTGVMTTAPSTARAFIYACPRV